MQSVRHATRLGILAVLLHTAFAAMPAHAQDAGAPAAAKPPAAPKAAAKSPARAAKKYTIEQFMATTSIGGASFNHDETKILFSSNESGIFNVYSMPVNGGKPTRLTNSTADSTYAVSYFWDNDRFLFTRDKGGDEQNHLFVRELDGTERDLTPGDKLKAAFAGWNKDGSAFYVLTNERNPKFFDVYRYDARTYARTMLFTNDSGMEPGAISFDEKWIALNKINTTADTDVYLFNTATKEMKHITPHQGTAGYRAATFDPDSKRLLLTSDDGGEFASVRAYDLAGGAMKEIEKADWDIAGTAYSQNGRYRMSMINADGSTVIRIVDAATEKPIAMPKTPGGEIRGTVISRSGKLMAFYVNGDRSPNNLYAYDMSKQKATQLTQSLSKEIDPNDLVEAEVVRFRSFDGMVIPSIYYKPKHASATDKVPAVIFVHGGPGGQTRRGYSAQIQYLVNHGYAVLGINNRGSSGYGKTFFTADDGKHGREPLWDCIEAKTFLAGLGHVDPERIAIMGGSYGGYMTLAAMAFRPEAFKVGIDIFGVSNWLRTLESIPPYWEAMRKALYQEIGDPVKDKEFLTATSPLFHASNIRKPLLVIQGKNDPRVIKPESDEIVEAVKKNGVPVEYIVFDDEGHGFSKKKNQAVASAKIREFLDMHLKGAPAASGTKATAAAKQ